VIAIPPVNRLEIPSAGDNLSVGLTPTRSGLKADERSRVRVASGEEPPLLLQAVRRDPHAALETTESPAPKVAAEPAAAHIVSARDIEHDQAPESIPPSRPLLFGIAPTQCVQSTLFAKPIDTLVRRSGIALQELLFLQG
jgi:hypothetical protein